jgi:lipopolysaccharide transport system permease protein
MLSALNPIENYRAATELVSLLTKRRALLVEMVRRDMIDQYAGQFFGAVWLILHPIILIGVYVMLFSFIFKIQMDPAAGYRYDYTVYILSGLIPWIALAGAIGRSATALTGHANLVKQVVFPIEILPIKVAIASALLAVVGSIVLIWYVCLRFGVPPVTYLLLPVLILMQISFMSGLTMLFSSIGIFMRDMKDFTQVAVIVGVYFVPAVYLPNWAPEAFRPFLNANPLSHIIWCYQDALFFGQIQHPDSWIIFALMALILPVLGYRLFTKLRPSFGDFL